MNDKDLESRMSYIEIIKRQEKKIRRKVEVIFSAWRWKTFDMNEMINC